MIDKEELIERIENTLTTRTVKELFKSIVDQCKDTPIPKKKSVSYHDDLFGDVEKNYTNIGWNACIDALFTVTEREEDDEN